MKSRLDEIINGVATLIILTGVALMCVMACCK